MFVDEINISVIAGDGGDGCTAFRREKYISMGGPFGGNGGNGGNIIFKVDEGLRTLIDLRYKKIIKAAKGANGEGKAKNGRNALATVIKVPLGTTIFDKETSLVIGDLIKKDDEVVVAYGGRGGRGNVTLATRANPCPNVSENGEPGEERLLRVELKMLADIGLVGLPSVGKSSLLESLSNAKPKIAAYHFTTLNPNLGVVKSNDGEFIVADLPGLIEGASQGQGLGIKFLRHIERTKIIAHVIDMGQTEGRDAFLDYQTITKELAEFSPKLLEKKQVIIANKKDAPNFQENLKLFKEKLGQKIDVLEVSALTKEGINELIPYLHKLVLESEAVSLYDDEVIESHVLYKFKEEKPFTITKDNQTWVVRGDKIEKILRMTKFNTDESIERFARKLRRLGLDDELERLGATEGDKVRILDYEFEYTK